MHKVSAQPPKTVYDTNGNAVAGYNSQLPNNPNSVNGVPVNDYGKGTQMQRSNVNPFEQDINSEIFTTKPKDGGYGFNEKNGLKAKQYTQEACNILAEKFNQIEAKMKEIIRKHPNTPAANYAKNILEELYSIDIGKPPKPETKGKQEDRLEAYRQDLFGRVDEVTGQQVSPGYVDRMMAELEALDSDSELNMILSQMNANTGAIIMNDNKNTAQVLALGQANLAATMNVHQALVEGLREVSEQIDTATHTIIKAVNAQGQRVVRAIDKATGKIISVVQNESNEIQRQAFWNTVGIHRNINYTRNQLNLKIDETGQVIQEHVTDEHQTTRSRVSTEHRRTRKHVTNEHEETRQFTKDEIKEHTVHWHGLPDPLGIGDWLFD